MKSNSEKIKKLLKLTAFIANIGFVSNRKDRDYLKSEGRKIDVANKILSFSDGLNH